MRRALRSTPRCLNAQRGPQRSEARASAVAAARKIDSSMQCHWPNLGGVPADVTVRPGDGTAGRYCAIKDHYRNWPLHVDGAYERTSDGPAAKREGAGFVGSRLLCELGHGGLSIDLFLAEALTPPAQELLVGGRCAARGSVLV